MNSGDELENPPELSSVEIASLLEKASQQDGAGLPPQLQESLREGVELCDFRSPRLISPREIRVLRRHQEEFADALASRLSTHFRLDFSAKLASVETIYYQKLASSWATPSNLSLFRLEPLRGIGVLEIPPRLGAAIVDRLMGGPGVCPDAPPEISEIEKALLEQAVRIILSEWAAHWPVEKELKPQVLGYENNGRFVQCVTPEAIMLSVLLEARLGKCEERIKIGIPFGAVEAIIRKFGAGPTATESAPAPASATARPATPASAPAAAAQSQVMRWNSSFDEVCIPVTAEWPGMEAPARTVAELKVGDVLPLGPQFAQQINIRLAEKAKFHGRLGAIDGMWAVEITKKTGR